jgi:hypothetical protein
MGSDPTSTRSAAARRPRPGRPERAPPAMSTGRPGSPEEAEPARGAEPGGAGGRRKGGT